MTEWVEPTDQQVDEVVGRLGNEQHRRYFFERLQNPRWLLPLDARNIFTSPPQPWTDAQGEPRLPHWTAGEYLARMTASEPDLVVDIVTRAKPTSNSLVHRTFVDIGLAVPPPVSVRLVPLVPEWLKSPYRRWLAPHRLAEWVAHLTRGQETTSALRLAWLLVEVRRSDSPAGDHSRRRTRARTGITTWLDSYDYAAALNAMIADLAETAGIQALELVNNQLETWLRHGGQGSLADRLDHSWLWRPSIAAHEQNMGNTIEDALIDAARDAARLIAEHGDSQLTDVIAAFERRRWTVFRRLALNLLADVLSARPDRTRSAFPPARDRVLDAGNLNDHRLVHEYSSLARSVLPLLDGGEMEAWTNLIDQGPTIEETTLRQRLAADVEARGNQADAGRMDHTATPTVDQLMELYQERWRRDRLGAVRDALPAALQERYTALAQHLGEAQHSDFASYTSAMWTGPTSPKAQQEILALGIDDLILFLQDWRPERTFWPPGPDVEGLARELAAAVTADPRHFAERAEDFASCGRSYVRALLQGFEAALREGRSFPWSSVTTLCATAAGQADDEVKESGIDEEDPSWRWAKQEAASLLLQGLQPSAGELPAALGGQVLQVLAELGESPDPTPTDDEQTYGSDTEDPVTVALNSTRGQAVRGLIAYAAWRTRQGRSEADLGDVAPLLDQHLDPVIDPSSAVRSVYGQHFRLLLGIMPEWARSRSERIFGSNLPLDRPQHTAGLAYLAFNQPTSGLLEALRPQYTAWVKAVADGVFDQEPLYSFNSIAERLGEHLLLLYVWGHVDLDSGPLADFFKTAPVEVRSRTLGHAGWQLWRSEDEVPTEVLMRLQILWESRRAAIEAASEQAPPDEGTSSAAELAAFGWWFRSDRFDREWALKQLLLALEHMPVGEEVNVDVTKQVARIANTNLEVALHAYDRLLHLARQTWHLSEVVHEGTVILKTSIESGQARLADQADGLINEIAGWGFLDIRDRIRSASSHANAEEER